MKIPPIKMEKLVDLLKVDGGRELAMYLNGLCAGKMVQEWNTIIRILEMEVVPLLAKGCDAKALAAPANKLRKSACALSLMASEILSFVPGPVGIVCSLVNAIVYFSMGNIGGGFLELLGCIPGGKVSGKTLSQTAKLSKTARVCESTSTLASKFKKILVEMVENNKALTEILAKNPFSKDAVRKFINKYGRNVGKGSDDIMYKAYSSTAHDMTKLEKSIKKTSPSPGKNNNPFSSGSNVSKNPSPKLDSGYSPANAAEARKMVNNSSCFGNLGTLLRP